MLGLYASDFTPLALIRPFHSQIANQNAPTFAGTPFRGTCGAFGVLEVRYSRTLWCRVLCTHGPQNGIKISVFLTGLYASHFTPLALIRPSHSQIANHKMHPHSLRHPSAGYAGPLECRKLVIHAACGAVWCGPTAFKMGSKSLIFGLGCTPLILHPWP